MNHYTQKYIAEYKDACEASRAEKGNKGKGKDIVKSLSRALQQKSKVIYRIGLIGCSLAITFPAELNAQVKPSALEKTGYDFAYSVLGDKTLITQAFDDGKKTFLSIPKNTTQAEIDVIVNSAIVTTGEQSWPITIHESQPYLVADGVFENLLIAVDKRVVSISYQGDKKRPPLQTDTIEVHEVGKKNLATSVPVPAKKPVEPAVKSKPTPPMAQEQIPLDLMASPFEIQNQPVLTVNPFDTGKSVEAKPLPPLPASTGKSRIEEAPANLVSKPVAQAVPSSGMQKLLVPFAEGKTTLGKEGGRATDALIEVAQYCEEIKITAPTDADNNLDKAFSRAMEIQKRLFKAGLTEQKYSIGTVKGISADKIVFAEIEVKRCGN